MEYVCEGEINIEKINAGEEILVVSTKNIPSFTAEETYVFASALCGEETYGISGINVSEPVKIGAVIRIPDSADPLLKRLTANDETQLWEKGQWWVSWLVDATYNPFLYFRF